MAASVIQEILLVSVLALTIKAVEAVDKNAAWLYAIILLLAYALTQPQRYITFVNFFSSLLQGKQSNVGMQGNVK